MENTGCPLSPEIDTLLRYWTCIVYPCKFLNRKPLIYLPSVIGTTLSLFTNICSYTHYKNDSLIVSHSRVTENFRTILHQPNSCKISKFCYICPTCLCANMLTYIHTHKENIYTTWGRWLRGIRHAYSELVLYWSFAVHWGYKMLFSMCQHNVWQRN